MSEGQTPVEAQRLKDNVAYYCPNNNIVKNLTKFRTIYT